MNDWQEHELQDLFTVQNGYAFRSSQYVEFEEGVLEVLKMGHIERGGGLRKEPKRSFVPREDKLKRWILDEGDIVMAMTDMKDNVVILGVPAIVDKNNHYALNQRVARLKLTSSKANLIFLYNYLKWPEFLLELQSKANSGVQVNLSTEAIKTSIIALPPIEEQEAIAAVLASLDDKIDLLHRQNKTLEALAQTLFRHWFIDGADDDWEIGTLGNLGKVVTGKTPSTKTREYWGYEIDFVTPTDFKSFGKYAGDTSRSLSESGKEKVKKSLIPPNSILVTCIGSDMGKVAISTKECVTNQQINSLVTDDPQKFAEYAYQYLKSIYPLLRSMALGGTTMPIINKTDFSNIEIPIPPDEPLILFNEVTSSFNEKIANNTGQIKTLEQLRDTLLPKLMSGEVRVRQN